MGDFQNKYGCVVVARRKKEKIEQRGSKIATRDSKAQRHLQTNRKSGCITRRAI
jgi:hypothetical protein